MFYNKMLCFIMEDIVRRARDYMSISELELHWSRVTIISCIIDKDIMYVVTECCDAWVQR